VDKEKEKVLDNIIKDNIFKNNPIHYSTIPASDIEVKVDGIVIDSKDLQNQYIWIEEKERNNVFEEKQFKADSNIKLNNRKCWICKTKILFSNILNYNITFSEKQLKHIYYNKYIQLLCCSCKFKTIYINNPKHIHLLSNDPIKIKLLKEILS